MDIKIAGSNPAEVVLGVDVTNNAVMYSTDGNTWNATSGSTGGATADDVLNAIGNYEEQLSTI